MTTLNRCVVKARHKAQHSRIATNHVFFDCLQKNYLNSLQNLDASPLVATSTFSTWLSATSRNMMQAVSKAGTLVRTLQRRHGCWASRAGVGWFRLTVHDNFLMRKEL